MKSKFLNIASAAVLLLAAGLTGCTREEANDENATRSMFLQVGTATTRATTDAVGEDEAELSTGYVFFTTTGGSITKILEITENDAYNSETEPDQVSIGQLKAGVPILNVPASSMQVHVFSTLGNDVDLSGVAVGDNISDCKETALPVATLFDEGGVATVPLYGSGPINSTSVVGEFTANVQVVPVAGRVELTQISAKSDIKSFKVEGVYVNYYYTQLGIAGAVLDGGDLLNNGTDKDKYAAGESGYTTAGQLYDEPGTGSVAKVVTFGTDEVLAYNLLAPASGTYFPHLIVKLSTIVTENAADAATYAGKTWFLTVRNVELTSAPGANLNFRAGNVYNIGNLEFGLADLTTVPELANISVEVKVTVKKWTPNAVTPIL
jgi:hypothetical protein